MEEFLGEAPRVHTDQDALIVSALSCPKSPNYQGFVELLADGVDDEASEPHASCTRMADIGERTVARTSSRW